MAKTICLNMLLENDDARVFDALASALPLLDCWVIVELNCSDVFLSKVEEALNEIPGEIVSVEFENYAAARNDMLAFSHELYSEKADYFLFLNANQTLALEKKSEKPDLEQAVYLVRDEAPIQRAEIRFLKSDSQTHYIGATREVLLTPTGLAPYFLEGITTQTFLSKDDKTALDERDRITLAAELVKHPNDPHVIFNLARIAMNQSQTETALDLFKQFVGLQEQLNPEWSWFAHYNIARLMESQNQDQQQVVNAYLHAYSQRTERAEPLYELARLHRQLGDYAVASIYSTRAFGTPLPLTESLDLNKNLYHWTIPSEHALISQQLNRHGDAVTAINAALLNGQASRKMVDSLRHNRQKSVEVLQQAKTESEYCEQNHIRLLIPFRNAKPYLAQCIDSIKTQDYTNFSATFIDDCSDDGSADLVPKDDNRFQLMQNKERLGPLLNRLNFILACEPNDIVFYLDGDDQLAADDVLSYINQVYAQHDCWLSYGQFLSQNANHGNAVPYANQGELTKVIEQGNMRFPIHPITHRAGLMQRIKKFDADFDCYKDDNGEWLFYASDAVLARPLFCLAGIQRVHYCDRVLYLYTEGHENSVFVSNNPEQIEACRISNGKPKLMVQAQLNDSLS